MASAPHLLLRASEPPVTLHLLHRPLSHPDPGCWCYHCSNLRMRGHQEPNHRPAKKEHIIVPY